MGFIKRYIVKRRMKKIVSKIKALSEEGAFKIDPDSNSCVNEEVWNKYAESVTKTLDHIVPGTKVEYKGSEGTNANFTITWPYEIIDLETITAEWVDKDGISDFFYCSNCDYKAHYTEINKVQCPNCKAKITGIRSDIIW